MTSRLKEMLSGKKPEILSGWFDLIAEGYPEETARFLKNRTDRFANPVGHAVHESIEGIFDRLIDGAPTEASAELLDNIIRIRAVQDFTAAGAVVFLFQLKGLLRDVVRMSAKKANVAVGEYSEELLALDRRIDALALLAFDIYMKCREKIYDIKANEARNMTFRLLQRANLIVEGSGL